MTVLYYTHSEAFLDQECMSRSLSLVGYIKYEGVRTTTFGTSSFGINTLKPIRSGIKALDNYLATTSPCTSLHF